MWREKLKSCVNNHRNRESLLIPFEHRTGVARRRKDGRTNESCTYERFRSKMYRHRETIVGAKREDKFILRAQRCNRCRDMPNKRIEWCLVVESQKSCHFDSGSQINARNGTKLGRCAFIQARIRRWALDYNDIRVSQTPTRKHIRTRPNRNILMNVSCDSGILKYECSMMAWFSVFPEPLKPIAI